MPDSTLEVCITRLFFFFGTQVDLTTRENAIRRQRAQARDDNATYVWEPPNDHSPTDACSVSGRYIDIEETGDDGIALLLPET